MALQFRRVVTGHDASGRAVVKIDEIAKSTHGVAHRVGIAGQSMLLNANGSNFGSMYVVLDEFHHRHGADRAHRRRRWMTA